jgi:hypothetical protein
VDRGAHSPHPVRAWLTAWLGGPVIGVANGVAREKLYAGRLGEQRAHQVSVATAIAAFAGYFAALQQRWPIRSKHDARVIGAAWVGLTVMFEFGFGRLLARKSWAELAADYNVANGRLWPLVLVWLGIGPSATRPRAPV